MARERKIAAATWATLSDQQQGFFYMHHPTGRITHTTAFVIPMDQWLEREIAQWVHHEGRYHEVGLYAFSALRLYARSRSLLYQSWSTGWNEK